MRRKATVTLIITILICWFYSSAVFANPFERRRDQFQNTPGLLILPIPYSIPGIGEGLFLIASFNNIFDTPTDVSLIGFTGDAEGYFGLVEELFVIPSFAYVTFGQGVAARFGQNVYGSRGMDNEKEDFNIFVGEDSTFANYEAVITLFERRFELTAGVNTFDGNIVEIRDTEGELIQEFDDPIETESSGTYYQVQLDITDDYNDPRSGLNLRVRQEQNPADNDGDPEYDTLTSALTLYLPLLEESTWVFHYFRSGAIVFATGNTDLESLKAENGFSACNGQADCESAVLATSQNQLSANKNGTAKALGGTNRLRSYPSGRYRAAHSELYGTEFRWNFKGGGETDLFFFKDVIDSLQVAFFYEQGSVVEEEEDLGTIVRSSYGAGVRFVGQSGSVYRFDVATGDEGVSVIAFFDYPWGGGFGS